MENKQLEKVLKALADSTRLKILTEIAKCKGSLQCAHIINITNLAQPSVSHHIKTLIEADLIVPEKDGRNHSYMLNKPLIDDFLQTIAGLVES